MPTLVNIKPLVFDRHLLFHHYAGQFGVLTGVQATGLDRLLCFIEHDPAVTDLRWAAYMLATVKWETGNTWRPIEEYRRGAGRRYAAEVEVTGSDGVARRNRYYGRGYVQLTWEANYKSASADLGLGEELWLDPQRALQPEIAYRIMSHGMTTGGAFANGRMLKDYEIGPDRFDYQGARRIVNGTDHAAEIAGIAAKMEAILRASV
jgi:hypothetical protein